MSLEILVEAVIELALGTEQPSGTNDAHVDAELPRGDPHLPPLESTSHDVTNNQISVGRPPVFFNVQATRDRIARSLASKPLVQRSSRR